MAEDGLGWRSAPPRRSVAPHTLEGHTHMQLYPLLVSLHLVSPLPRPCLPLPITMPSGWVPRRLWAAGEGLAHLCVSDCSWPHHSCPRSHGSHHRRSPGGGRAPDHTSARPRHSSLQCRQRRPGWQWCPMGHPPLPRCPGRYGRPSGATHCLPTARSPGSARGQGYSLSLGATAR